MNTVNWVSPTIHRRTLASVASSNGLRRKITTSVEGKYNFTYLIYLFADGDCYYELTLNSNDNMISFYEEINEICTYELKLYTIHNDVNVVTTMDYTNNIQTINYYSDTQGNNRFINDHLSPGEVREKAARLWHLANSKIQDVLIDPAAKVALRSLPLPIINEIWHHYRTI